MSTSTHPAHGTISPALSTLTEEQLCRWLGNAASGDRLEYHRGFLAVDRASSTSRLTERQRREVQRVADRALWAAQQGFAHLLQERLGRECFRYLIVASVRPRPLNGGLVAVAKPGDQT